MRSQGETCPPLVETRREMGQNIRTVNVGASATADGWEWISVTLPPAVWNYGAIVDALVTECYPPDKMQAVINNCLNNFFNPEHLDEYRALQEWRKTAKHYAHEAMNWGAEHGIEPVGLEPDDGDSANEEQSPDGMLMLQQAVTLLKGQAVDLPDEKAIEVPALFPTWASKMGQTVAVDERLYYDSRLWKVLQAHTVQADWTPTAAAALFTEVVAQGEGEPELGTLDNPIPYSGNMALEQGKYYSQGGVTYLCIRDTGNPVYHDLSALVGLYVQAV